MRQKLTILIILSLLAVVGCGGSGTDKSKELELKEKELALKEKELELKQKSSKNGDSEKAGNTNKTETAKAADPASTKGCQRTTAVQFKKGTYGQTFKCQMSAKNSQHEYTLNVKTGQMFDIQFETDGAGPAPHAVYKIADPQGLIKRQDVEENSGLQFDKTGAWTVTVDLSSSASNPSAEYTITFTIGGRDGS